MFGYYFVNSLLRHMGWPRKPGLFKGAVFDTTVVNHVAEQMVDWAAAIGAGRPRMALQAVAGVFCDRDWDSDDVPDIRAAVQKWRDEKWAPAAHPAAIVPLFRLPESVGPSITPTQLSDPQIQMALEQVFLEALLWGLAHPEQFAASYRSRAQEREESLEFQKQAGLDVTPPDSLAEWFEHSESILRDYEREVSPLPPLPRRLVKDAEALGRSVTG